MSRRKALVLAYMRPHPHARTECAPCTRSEIASILGVNPRQAARVLRQLRDDGLVRMVEYGWLLTEAGKKLSHP